MNFIYIIFKLKFFIGRQNLTGIYSDALFQLEIQFTHDSTTVTVVHLH